MIASTQQCSRISLNEHFRGSSVSARPLCAAGLSAAPTEGEFPPPAGNLSTVIDSGAGRLTNTRPEFFNAFAKCWHELAFSHIENNTSHLVDKIIMKTLWATKSGSQESVYFYLKLGPCMDPLAWFRKFAGCILGICVPIPMANREVLHIHRR